MKQIIKVILFIIAINTACLPAGELDSLYQLEQQTVDIKQKINILNKISFTLRSTDNESGKDYAQKALALADSADYIKGKAEALKNMGIHAWGKGDYHVAIDYDYESLKFYEQINDREGIAAIENNIGLIYLTQGEYAKGLNNFRKANRMASEINNIRLLGTTHHNIGIIFKEMKEYDSALKHQKICLDITKERNDTVEIIRALSFIGLNYTLTDDYQQAEKYLLESMKYFNNNHDREYSMVNSFLANLYLKKHDYRKAVMYGRTANDYAKKTKTMYNIYESSKYLSEAYARMQDFRKAYFYGTEVNAYYDTMMNREKRTQIAQLEAKYQYEKKLQEAKHEQAQKDLITSQKLNEQKIIIYAFVISLFLALIIVGLLYYSNKNRKKTNKELREKNDEISQNRDELKYLNNMLKESNATKDKFFSIIAHDLKNPISSYHLIANDTYEYYDTLDDSDKRESIFMMKESSKNLYALLENLLTWSRSQRGVISYQPEKIAVRILATQVLAVQDIAAEKKSINLVNDVPEDIFIKADPNMINTVLRNLVSNAIKYTDHQGSVTINAEKSDNMVHISVKDSGVGMNKVDIPKLFDMSQSYSRQGTDKERGTGLGLILCKEFVNKNNGKIRVKSEKGKGSEFIVSLPPA